MIANLRHSHRFFAILPVVVSLLSVAIAYAHGPGHNPSRHQYIMLEGVPAAYKGQLNRLQRTASNLSNGKRLYVENCANCHGATGRSDTEIAKDLAPPPTILLGMYDSKMIGMGKTGTGAHMMHGMMHHHPGMTHAEAMGGLNLDAYTFWAVSEGGEPVGSDMPSFKGVLSEEERWQIILYIANDFSTKTSG